MITAVLAGSLRQFKDWCRENEVDPRDQNVLYVGEARHLRGLGKPVQLVVYGTFWGRPGAMELHAEASHVAAVNAYLPDPDPPRPWSWTITSL